MPDSTTIEDQLACEECGVRWPRAGMPSLKGGCSGCRREYGRRWRALNQSRIKVLSRRHYDKHRDQLRKKALDHYHSSDRRFKRYGITREEYLEMFEKQSGECAICGHSPSNGALDIDHDHKTNRVRGLLCRSCNRALGYFKDDHEVIIRAADYLTRKEM